MAFSSLKNAKLLPSLVTSITCAISGRGYSAASSLSMVRKQGEEIKVVVVMMMMEGGADSAWALDPVTGYYKHANQVGEIDHAELREMLLNNRKKVHQH